jgi:hypothetical protein
LKQGQQTQLKKAVVIAFYGTPHPATVRIGDGLVFESSVAVTDVLEKRECLPKLVIPDRAIIIADTFV